MFKYFGIYCEICLILLDGTFSPDDIAVRFHHRLVAIHPFPNGNGRHARLMADVLVMKLGHPAFTWGSIDLVKPGEARARYLDAIRAADNGDVQPLLEFARS
jgi:Fic-DOC domain mobile mystery protein B